MPSPYIKNLSKETGKSEKEIEKLWDKAKKITAEEFGKSEDDFGSKEYAYTTGVVKKMLGVDEAVLDPSKFLNSKLSAKEFLETVVSGNFSIGNVSPPSDDEDDEYKIETAEEEELYQPTPDGTGPHGNGRGPGQGKADGTGMKTVFDDEEDSDTYDYTEEEKQLLTDLYGNK